MENGTKVNGVPENEGFWAKAKRKARTAVEWGKTHWKGIAIGAVAIGGGAYMLSRRGSSDEGEDRTVDRIQPDSRDYHVAIDEAFETGDDGSDVGPEDDDPDVVDE